MDMPPEAWAEAEDLSNNNIPEDKLRAACLAGPNSCSCLDTQPLDTWEGGLDAAETASETAELIAHRMGGMKLSATVIFNPKSPRVPDGPGQEVPEPEGVPCRLGTGASHCLLHSCVCCAGCGPSREEVAESPMDKCSRGPVFGSAHVGGVQGLEAALPGPEALPPGAAVAPVTQDSPLTPNNCPALSPGGPGGDSNTGGQLEPGTGRQDEGQPVDGGEDQQLVAQAGQQPPRGLGSSGSPASSRSADLPPPEAVPVATKEKIRSRFHGSHDLIHRLFVCISGVADQLQTNYASDLRSILKTLFEVMASKPETDDKDKLKKVTQTLRSATLEDCALCQESLSSSELAAKTRDGDLEDPPEWVPDEACGFCTACKAPFTVIRRKHHCRSCGKIFCSRCSSHSAPLPRYGQVKPVRVCTHCYMFHVTPFYSDRAAV